jgi:hypothetical protein
VFVHLYFAAATGAPPKAPDLDADFWATFSGVPAAAKTWQKAGEVHFTGDVRPAQPRVARFDWTPPLTLGVDVALLALCTQAASDSLTGIVNVKVDPQTHNDDALVVKERRAALRIVKAQRSKPDLYVRDSVDDTGPLGAAAWGGRSGDIIVSDVVIANPNDPAGPLVDISDARESDVIHGKGGAADVDNHVYVRVFNRRNLKLSTKVKLFYVPFAKLATPNEWVEVDAAAGGKVIDVNDVEARSSKISSGFRLRNPIDPAPDQTYKTAILVALIGDGDDPMPDPKTKITNLDTFWRFFLSEETANNAAFRGLKYLPKP